MHYDIEANIITIELASGQINNVLEFGNFLIHASPSGKPILIEILDASKFIGKLEKLNDLKDIKKIKELSEEV
ncbi:MAG: hypothetical protein AAB906_00205 [Patescibacteria group bacterium]